MDTLVSVMLTGLPRFGKDTDTLIDNIKYADRVRYYVVFWRHNPSTMSWFDPRFSSWSEQEMREFIQTRLPDNHSVQYMEWVDPNDLDPMPRAYPEFYSTPLNCWQQYSLLRHADERRRKIEALIGAGPDVVIRARTDAGMDRPLDFRQLAKILKQDPRLLIMPRNQRQGPGGYCDHMTISRSENITKLAMAVTEFDRAWQTGTPYNAELLLTRILTDKGLIWPMTDWNSTLKTQGHYDQQGHWHQDPGRWAYPD